MNTTTNPLVVLLGKLVPREGNARRTGAATGIDELAASIAAHGLINPLTVRPTAEGGFAVIAGQRRLLALRHLAGSGRLAKDAPVACHSPGLQFAETPTCG